MFFYIFIGIFIGSGLTYLYRNFQARREFPDIHIDVDSSKPEAVRIRLLALAKLKGVPEDRFKVRAILDATIVRLQGIRKDLESKEPKFIRV